MIDQNSQFFAMLTAVGEAKHANAIALGLDWAFTEMGVGDANGTDPIPDRLQTQLINEWRRAPINQIRVDPANASVVITEQVIPADVGGKWIREIGLYDVDGDLVAVANCAPSYKPLLEQGTGKTQVVRMNFIVSSSANITLKIDPAVVLATREYVDLAIVEALAKLDGKQSVLVATTAPITLENTQSIDGVALVVGDRVLVKDQAQAQDNGLYLVASGAWTRAADADASVEVTPGLFVPVERGTVNGDSVWQLVSDGPITLGTTALQFEMIDGRSGVSVGTYRSVSVDAHGRVIAGTNPTTLDGYGITDALAASNNLADVEDAAEARDNLGLGSGATHDAQSSPTDTTAGRLMEVGAFGLGVQGPTVVDLDVLQGTQFFGFRDGADGGLPVTSYDAIGWLVEASGQRTQFAVANSALFIRSDDGSAWDEWVQQWDNRTLVKQANATDATAGHVLLNGAFGLGGLAPGLPGDDFNAAQVGGDYTYEGSTLNRPDVFGAGTVGVMTHVERAFKNHAYQEAREKNGKIFYRFRTGDFATGTWGDWQIKWDSANLVKQANSTDTTAGRVLLNGAFGLGGTGISLPAGTDLNTVRTAGFYRLEGEPDNGPSNVTNSVLIVGNGRDVTAQLIVAFNTGELHTRGGSGSGSTWSPWKKQWDNGSLVKQADATDATAGRVLLNGAFGLGSYAPELPDRDFNAAQVGGTYTYAADYLNRPDVPNGSTHGFVTHMERSFGNLAYQEARAANGSTHYRYRTGDFATGTWGAWEHLWDSSNLALQTSASDDTPGSVLLAGAYGWGQGGIVIPDGTDLNTVLSAGVYRVNTGPNVPSGGEYSPMLVMVAQDVLTQMIINNTSGTIYSRGCITGGAGFGPWVTNWNSANFNPALYQAALGFTPVQQGTGTGQLSNIVKIGWGAVDGVGDRLLCTVDAYNLGSIWTDNYGNLKVSAAIASFSAYGVGSHGLFRVYGGVSVGPDSLVAGANLHWTDCQADTLGASPSGTWRCLGHCNSADGQTSDSVTVFVRVA